MSCTLHFWPFLLFLSVSLLFLSIISELLCYKPPKREPCATFVPDIYRLSILGVAQGVAQSYLLYLCVFIYINISVFRFILDVQTLQVVGNCLDDLIFFVKLFSTAIYITYTFKYTSSKSYSLTYTVCVAACT